ncbi:MAG: hypothetical protein ACKVUS_14580 [Saprospiraceae bacterium]
MSHISHYYFYLLRATVWLFRAFGGAARHFRARVLRSLALPEGLALAPSELHRLKHYFYGATYLAALMCSLRNRPRSKAEKHLFDNLSALACFFDDLVDANPRRFSSTSERARLTDVEAYGLATDKRGLALHLLHNIYRALPERDLRRFREFMHRVFEAETAGRQDVGESGTGNRDIAALQKITAEKGGCSVLLFRSVLSHALSQAEEQALFEFGCLIQLCDDIFDLWHDRQAGIVTLATLLAERSEVGFLNQLFEQQVAATHEAFRRTAYPAAQIETALSTLCFLTSITRVCLRHYQNLEKKHGALPFARRAAVVVDMDIWANRLWAAGYLLRPEVIA